MGWATFWAIFHICIYKFCHSDICLPSDNETAKKYDFCFDTKTYPTYIRNSWTFGN
jgi:hypothetical protein